MDKIKELLIKIILKDVERNRNGKPSIISYVALIVAIISLILTIISK